MSNLKLFHGTFILDGETISLRPGEGAGSNDLNQGNGFYTTTCEELGLYYSHMMARDKLYDLGKNPDLAGIGRVYEIYLDSSISILDAGMPINSSLVSSILEHSNLDQNVLATLDREELADFRKTVDIFEYFGISRGDASEYLTKALGFDAVDIIPRKYLPWYYEPENIDVNWKKMWSKWENDPPRNVVIYNTDKIVGFSLVHDGIRDSRHFEDLESGHSRDESVGR